MKKVSLAATVILSSVILFSANALDVQGVETNGRIEYGTGTLVIDPNPTDPTDPTTPIDPETGNPDPEQPGGNMNTRLPKNLNFGYHVNQTTASEKWVAKNVNVTGLTNFDDLSAAYNAASNTLGALLIEDNRTTEGKWEVKVKQANPFAVAGDPTENLGATILSISTGAVWNNISNAGVTSGGSVLNITPNNQEINVLVATLGNGAGISKLPLTRFELTVPANVSKESVAYTTDLNWTISEAP